MNRTKMSCYLIKVQNKTSSPEVVSPSQSIITSAVVKLLDTDCCMASFQYLDVAGRAMWWNLPP